MKTPVIDYREFRFSKLNTPQFSHLKLLLGWVGYFILFFLTENLIPAEKCYPIHCWLDDVIPFMEIFILPYFFWYLLVVGSLLYFLLYDVEQFKNLQKFIIITQVVAMIAYICLPSRQDLRPEVFPRENILTSWVGLLYSLDTNTGVCPSLHVAYSLGIASVWLKAKGIPRWFKGVILVLVVLICISVAFVKQHSVLDIAAALPLGVLAEQLVFKKPFRSRKKRAE